MAERRRRRDGCGARRWRAEAAVVTGGRRRGLDGGKPISVDYAAQQSSPGAVLVVVSV